MIPFKDDNPTERFPYVTMALIIINGMVFIREITLGEAVNDVIFYYGVVPLEVLFYFSNPSLDPGTIKDTFLPFLTGMFLHGGPIHILGNMLYLWVFGDNVEDKLGHL
ncbi:MAG: rhomboid family intramembrane serine protease, partial [Planctomycetes bacterium]|nr:rhomboid family intramembrane serine protease [Planctomycetota bacterium]